jgi:hypothetical protein
MTKPRTQVRFVDIDELTPYERNARTHSEAQVAQLVRSIREFGWTIPVLADAQGIVAGHGRVMAARQIIAAGDAIRLPSGAPIPAGKIPVLDCSGWTDEQRRAYVIADNRLAENAGWDQDMLSVEIGSLQAADFDVTFAGFDQAEIDAILGGGDGGAGAAGGGATLADKFMVAPFSVLNAREGWWQARKAAWIALGIRSEVGRGGNLIGRSFQETMSLLTGTHYSEVKANIEQQRAAGMSDEQIIAKAQADNPARAKGAKGSNLLGMSPTLLKQRRGLTISGQDSLTAIQAKGNGRKQPQKVAGVLMTSDSGNDPRYYAKKQEAEAKLGRTLTTEEFQRDHYQGPDSYASGTSIFDPVLAELSYRWFCPPGGLILDPFAGGSVRGVVACKTGRHYIGHELRQEQVDANREQGSEICGDDERPPAWICGDSRRIDSTCGDVQADFVFSCPPYADLEVYSDAPDDLSAMDYADFLAAYREIIAKTCALLKPDRFACFVIGEVRDPKGIYRDFVGDTVQAFRDAGLGYYNEAILVTAAGSLPIRAGRTFSASRKLGKTHQNVLVFLKGDAKKAVASCGAVEIDEALFADAPPEGLDEQRVA